MKQWSCGHTKLRVDSRAMCNITSVVEMIDRTNHEVIEKERLEDVKTHYDSIYTCAKCDKDLTSEVFDFLETPQQYVERVGWSLTVYDYKGNAKAAESTEVETLNNLGEREVGIRFPQTGETHRAVFVEANNRWEEDGLAEGVNNETLGN